MYELSGLKNPREKEQRLDSIGGGILRLGDLAELSVVLAVWLYLFWESQSVGGYSRPEIVTYILGGSLISLFTAWLLNKLIRQDIRKSESKLLVYKPARYLGHLLLRGWAKVIMPFALAVCLHAALIIFFSQEIIVNADPLSLALIAAMVLLSFVFEFLFAYLVNIDIFWKIESERPYRLFERIRKMLSGAYFPLSVIPLFWLEAVLLLPFAYSFYVPAEIYLGRFGTEEAVRGIFIQLAWIVVLYVGVKIAWVRSGREAGEGGRKPRNP